MTVLVIRNGVFASDSLVTAGNIRYCQTPKIRKLADGSIIGAAGPTMHCYEMLEYFDRAVRRGGKITKAGIAKIPSVEGLWLRKDGVFGISSAPENGIGLCKLEGEFFAEGSGFTPALAAMHAGASAEKAVEIACMLDATCGLPVLVERLSRRLPGV